MTTTEHRWLVAPGGPTPIDRLDEPPQLDALVSRSGGRDPVVRLTGEIDLHTRHVLLEALHEVDRDAPVIIDLTDVTFMDSAGIHVLLDTRRRAPVTIRGARPFLRRLFELSGLQELFLFDDGPTDRAAGTTGGPAA
jgi:anti-sigma B factor antagonist